MQFGAAAKGRGGCGVQEGVDRFTARSGLVRSRVAERELEGLRELGLQDFGQRFGGESSQVFWRSNQRPKAEPTGRKTTDLCVG